MSNTNSSSNEQFKDAAPLAEGGWLVAEVERDGVASLPRRVGQLYIGRSFFTVQQARMLRDYLNEVLPVETLARHLQPRYVLEQIMNNSTDPWAKGVARTCLMGSSVETKCQHEAVDAYTGLCVTCDERVLPRKADI